MSCLCGLGINYELCCGRFIETNNNPPTAEELMRSRYSAYVLKKQDYILKTWHPSKRPKNLDLENDTSKYFTLKVLKVLKGLEKDFEGTVEFEAMFEQGGKIYKMRELSSFVKKNRIWFYRDGLCETFEFS
jgi:SEC-C motif domain protein